MNLLRRAAFVTPLLLSMAGVPALLMPAQVLAAEPAVARATENRSVGDFQAIGLQGAMDLVVRQGPQASVQVQADPKLLPLLETVVEGNALQVRWKRERGSSWSWKMGPVLVTVVVPRLTALSAAGSGDIRVEAFNTPTLQLALSGSSDAKLEALTTEDLGIRISGSGDVLARGTAAKVKVSIAGSGDVRLSDLRADDVTVSIAGSGDAAVNAQKSLVVSIAGSGDVSYTGNPAVKSSVAGSGSVTRK